MKIINEQGQVKESTDRRFVGNFGGFDIFEGSEVEVVNDKGFKEKGKVVYEERYANFQIAIYVEKLNRTFFAWFSKVQVTNLIKK